MASVKRKVAATPKRVPTAKLDTETTTRMKPTIRCSAASAPDCGKRPAAGPIAGWVVKVTAIASASAEKRFDHRAIEAFRALPVADEAEAVVEFPIGPADAVRLCRMPHGADPVGAARGIRAEAERAEL